MARPTEVTDEEILEAAGKLSAAGPINATRLWDALGRRGRPERLLKVWRQHEATLTGTTDHLPIDLPPVPEKAQMLADGLKGELSGGIDRAIKLIYAAVDERVRGRYRDELAETLSTRDACSREVGEALNALGDLSEALAERDETVESLSAALATTKGERDLAEALSGAESEHKGDLAIRLAKIEAAFEIERQSCVDLRVAHAKAEEIVAYLRAEKADWLEERERFRGAAERQIVDFALLQTENRQHLSMISAQQLTIGQLNGSMPSRVAPEHAKTISVDEQSGHRRIRTMGATGSNASRPPRRPRRPSASLIETEPVQDDTSVSDTAAVAPTDGGMGRAAL